MKKIIRLDNMTKDKFNVIVGEMFGLGSIKVSSLKKFIGVKSFLFINWLSMVRVLKLVKKYYFVGNKLEERRYFERRKLDDLGCLRGFRFSNSLPCNGQRTQTNAQTAKKRNKKTRQTTYLKAKKLIAAKNTKLDYLKFRKDVKFKLVAESGKKPIIKPRCNSLFFNAALDTIKAAMVVRKNSRK